MADYRDRRRRGGDLGRRGRGLRLRRRGDGVRRRGTYRGAGERRRGDRLRLGSGDRLRRRENTRGGERRLGGDLRITRRGDECDRLLLYHYQAQRQSFHSSYIPRPIKTAKKHFVFLHFAR